MFNAISAVFVYLFKDKWFTTQELSLKKEVWKIDVEFSKATEMLFRENLKIHIELKEVWKKNPANHCIPGPICIFLPGAWFVLGWLKEFWKTFPES